MHLHLFLECHLPYFSAGKLNEVRDIANRCHIRVLSSNTIHDKDGFFLKAVQLADLCKFGEFIHEAGIEVVYHIENPQDPHLQH